VKLSGIDEQSARNAENACYAKTSGENPEDDSTQPPSDLVVWLCVHCMDLPRQEDPQELYEIKGHLRTVYVLQYFVVCALSMTTLNSFVKSQYF
jgi:hypothetical protein